MLSNGDARSKSLISPLRAFPQSASPHQNTAPNQTAPHAEGSPPRTSERKRFPKGSAKTPGSTGFWGLRRSHTATYCPIMGMQSQMHRLILRAITQSEGSKTELGSFPVGSVVKNPPASAGHPGSIPDPGRPHMLPSNYAPGHSYWACALESHLPAPTEACAPEWRALQQEPSQWEACAPAQPTGEGRVPPPHCN